MIGMRFPWPAILLLIFFSSRVLAHDMRFESVAGEVTTNEYRSFIEHLDRQLPPTPSNNLGNVMAYERVGGATLHGMQTFYGFTRDRRVLDKAVDWSDAFLHARNDSTNGRILWTGRRELCWPNKDPNDTAHFLYGGTENGDVIEHICNTARLILENPPVWPESAPPDRFGFGATYLDRARTYVRECQRSAETTIVPWYVRGTKDGYRLIHPDSPVYYKYCESSGPVPWNQQQMIVGGLLRLAQCHRLLNDGNPNIAYYEKITGDAADWFFSTCLPVRSKDRACYQWSYVVAMDIPSDPEDTGHSYYDVYAYRACLADLGPTRTNMQRLINTARFIMYLGTNHFSGIINGTSNERRYERDYLNYSWIELSVLDRQFYKMTANAVLASREYRDDIPVEAAVLAAKHFWATNTDAPQEIIEDASGLPLMPRGSPILSKLKTHWRLAGIIVLVWLGVRLLMLYFRRYQARVKI